MISIIIPTYNEEAHIRTTIQCLWRYDSLNLIKEIIIADGGSTDNTLAIARTEGVKAVVSPIKGRSAQMNYGASLATTDIFYFLHADTVPPKRFSTDIKNATDNGYDAGCFMLSFDHHHWFLKANCWFTRFDVDAFHYGDQSLFVNRKTFEKLNGFCEKHILFEDFQMIRKLKKNGSFKIINRAVVTSARKYLDNGIFKMQMIFYQMYFLYIIGSSQQQLVSTYKGLIKQDKL